MIIQCWLNSPKSELRKILHRWLPVWSAVKLRKHSSLILNDVACSVKSNHIWNHYEPRKLWKTCVSFCSITVPADVLAPLGARTSADTLMTNIWDQPKLFFLFLTPFYCPWCYWAKHKAMVLFSAINGKTDGTLSQLSLIVLTCCYIEGILPKGPYPPCLRMADRAILAGYPWYVSDLHVWDVCNNMNLMLYALIKYSLTCRVNTMLLNMLW